jgi:hypothetical protein
VLVEPLDSSNHPNMVDQQQQPPRTGGNVGKRNNTNNKKKIVAAAVDNNPTSYYQELKNTPNDSLMISFDPTFNLDDDDNNEKKHVPHYKDFAKDILAVLKQHRSIQGCVEMIIACAAIVTLYSTALVYDLPWWSHIIAATIWLALYFCVRTYLHAHLCDALRYRIDEWRTLIYHHPQQQYNDDDENQRQTYYALEWVEPADWWNIYPGVQFIPKSSSSSKQQPHGTVMTTITKKSNNIQPIKYYCKTARFAPPRDLTARTIQDSTARPPALLRAHDRHDDDDDDDDDDASSSSLSSSVGTAFFQFLTTVQARQQLDQRRQLQRMVIVLVVVLIALWIMTEDCDLVVRAFFVTLVVFDVVDDCVIQHVLDENQRNMPVLLSSFGTGGHNDGTATAESDVVENGQPNNKKENAATTDYVVTYHVDLCGLRETYYTIEARSGGYQQPTTTTTGSAVYDNNDHDVA